jgi:Mn-dependent DtxR family transcriptional regulator
MEECSEYYVSVATQLVEAGFITIDENGDARLTEKGKKRAARRLDKLPTGDEILLNLAFCEAHEVPVSLF